MPLEYFNGRGRRAIEAPDYPDDRREQIRRILTLGSTPNGVYGFKIFASQFAEIGVALVTIIYEDPLLDSQGHVDRIAERVGVTGSVRIRVDRIDLRPQRDHLSEIWRDRFVAEHGDIDQPRPHEP